MKRLFLFLNKLILRASILYGSFVIYHHRAELYGHIKAFHVKGPQYELVALAVISFGLFLWHSVTIRFRDQAKSRSQIQSKRNFKEKNVPSDKYYLKEGYYINSKTGISLHREIAMEVLGGPLYPGQVVHHINGVKTENEITNLCVMNGEKHEQFHGWLKWFREKGLLPQYKKTKVHS